MDAVPVSTSEGSVSIVGSPIEQSEIPVPCLFNDPDGDVLLRTSDGEDFQVSKVVLKFASSVFKTMFSLPQPFSEEGSENATSLPVIPISESSTTLDFLLRFSYPVEHPDVASKARNVTAIVDLLCAARKYELDFILSPVRNAFKKRVEASKEAAMAGFALASHRNLAVETRTAAKACLKWPLRQIRGVVIPEFDFLPTTEYIRLLQYHDRAGQAVTDLFRDYRFLYASYPIGGCGSCCFQKVHISTISRYVLTANIDMSRWWEDWSKFLIGALQEAPLNVEVISLSTLSPFYMDRACDTCRKELFDEWDTGRKSMIDAINKGVDKVELRLGWM